MYLPIQTSVIYLYERRMNEVQFIIKVETMTHKINSVTCLTLIILVRHTSDHSME
jgi:hypothetical protein